MKTLKILLVLSLGFFLFSCNKDDDVNISQLEGVWTVVNENPNLIVEGYVTYTFNADKSCDIHVVDILTDTDTTYVRTYMVSHDNNILTLFEENSTQSGQIVYTEQYNIKKLTSKVMIWENTSPKDGNPMRVKLVRRSEN